MLVNKKPIKPNAFQAWCNTHSPNSSPTLYKSSKHSVLKSTMTEYRWLLIHAWESNTPSTHQQTICLYRSAGMKRVVPWTFTDSLTALQSQGEGRLYTCRSAGTGWQGFQLVFLNTKLVSIWYYRFKPRTRASFSSRETCSCKRGHLSCFRSSSFTCWKADVLDFEQV